MPTRLEVAPYIFTISEFLSADECRDYIELSESISYGEAPITGVGGRQEMAKDIRNNDRVILDDHERATTLWRRAKPFCPAFFQQHSVVGLNERFRFYRYDQGQVFRWHKDGAFRRANGESSRLTFLVYLNDDFVGGETLFEEVTIEPAKGMALIFAHGYLHEGGEVLKGRKYVLRTDVMYSADIVDILD